MHEWSSGISPDGKSSILPVTTDSIACRVTEAAFHRTLAWAVMAIGAIVFSSLFFVTAPYGRHARSGWGPTIASRLGWVIMESPAVLAFIGVYAFGRNALQPAPLVLCSLWLTHYVHRSFIFPLRLSRAG